LPKITHHTISQDDNTNSAPKLPVRYFKKVAAVLFLCLFLILVLNGPYVWVQVQFILHPPVAVPQNLPVQAPSRSEPNWLTVASLGIAAPVVYIDEKTEAVFQAALLRGVVHYPGTALPGQKGNVYIFGHSSDYLWSKGEYKTVFALLPKIQNGALITLSDDVGRQFTYKVYNQFVTSPDNLSVLDQGGAKKQLLTLQTSYPVGTALKRYIVQAELVQ
jgi:sortase A